MNLELIWSKLSSGTLEKVEAPEDVAFKDGTPLCLPRQASESPRSPEASRGRAVLREVRDRPSMGTLGTQSAARSKGAKRTMGAGADEDHTYSMESMLRLPSVASVSFADDILGEAKSLRPAARPVSPGFRARSPAPPHEVEYVPRGCLAEKGLMYREDVRRCYEMGLPAPAAPKLPPEASPYAQREGKGDRQTRAPLPTSSLRALLVEPGQNGATRRVWLNTTVAEDPQTKEWCYIVDGRLPEASAQLMLRLDVRKIVGARPADGDPAAYYIALQDESGLLVGEPSSMARSLDDGRLVFQFVSAEPRKAHKAKCFFDELRILAHFLSGKQKFEI